MDATNGKTTAVEHYANVNNDTKDPTLLSSTPVKTSPSHTGANEDSIDGETSVETLEAGKGGWFAYLKTRNFWIVIVLGYAVVI